ncbi:MAG: SDR family NAD(P)-dependent oxidoreductase [Clostridia bacterium]|nr:SDR family NAD(P)-dependent oxidoreductase [Clostridia bacterium]
MATKNQPDKADVIKKDRKVLLLTGGANGLGRATCREYAKAGYNVAFTDVLVEEGKKIEEELNKSGVDAKFYKADATDFKRAKEVVEDVLKTFGRIDVLVNNVGGGREKVIYRITEEQWDRVIELTLKSTFNYTRAVVDYFIGQQRGSIVNISSINGLRGREGQPAYSAAKMGVVGFTKCIAKELGRFNISVNAVAPGYIETDAQIENTPELVRKLCREESAIKRLADPEDIAYLVAFLGSEKASLITGEVVKIDSGAYI